MKKNPENILIVRTDRIGDLVLTLPLAGLIKEKYPQAKVSFWVRDYTKSITANHRYIDEVIVLKQDGNDIAFYENLNIIKSKKFDTCIVVYPTFLIALILFLSGIKTRIGTGYRWYSFLFNEKVYEHRKNAERHELEYNVNLLGKINIKNNVNEENVRYDLSVDKRFLNFVKNILNDNQIELSKPFIIIHPGSGGSSVDLSPDKFRLLTKLLSDDGQQIILTGSKSEKPFCELIKADTNAVNLAGKFELEELTALISLSFMFISNSTGPIHIAAALDKYVVGFYPKVVSCSKDRWSPYTYKKLIYEPSIDCNNCTIEQCKNLDCMESININKVFTDIKNVLIKNPEK
ncbi:MAG TPA: glycosyltransferase family 9 protein [Ignavibacteriaceae bacterium]|jgi:ADP-heptose:LPS heptosyltransferase|nr:MAG: ADP-heptose--LPS heptosyltransferase 2 [Ignavibacteria bacterium ADurb.Bin266]OQY75017.1 MAG: ADP-heptose--LPS heptosyltransferase [Ignavibacteriales bacterium UTCHB2]HQF41569.1 glycosyltransferase family 9 protein [Ignavibacteriaceae bacterium]HQI41787.1 glycosyltransferase family 9 protein [Ignavibacteriaceae bacterium]